MADSISNIKDGLSKFLFFSKKTPIPSLSFFIYKSFTFYINPSAMFENWFFKPKSFIIN